MENVNSRGLTGADTMSSMRVAAGLILLLASCAAFAADGRKVDFVRDVQPIFARSCVSCHGPLKRKGDYRLDVKAVALRREGAPAIVPGDPRKSRLIQYVSGEHAEVRMPPKGAMLPAEQVGVLRAWIEQGADWPESASAKADDRREFWAVRPLLKPPVPRHAAAERWDRNP